MNGRVGERAGEGSKLEQESELAQWTEPAARGGGLGGASADAGTLKRGEAEN